MKRFGLKGSLALLAMTFFLLLGPRTAYAQDEVTIQGADLPENILDVVSNQLDNPNNPGIEEVQFRDLNLSGEEAAELFFSTDPDENLLHSIGEALQKDQQVKFRGTVDGKPFETRVKREDDGTLRLRIDGMDVSGLSAEQLGDFLSSGFDRIRIRGSGNEKFDIRQQGDGELRAEFKGMDLSGYTPEQLANLAIDNGLDRLRIRGSGGERFDFERRADGTPRAEFKGINVSKYTLEQLTSLAAENGFDRLRIRGTDGQRYEIDRKGDGTLHADIRGMDVSGYTPEQLTSLAVEKGIDRLRIRGSRDERFEIKRQDNGTLRAQIERMDFSNTDPKEVLESLREKGLDRVRIRGVDKDGNRVRIEYRQDKGIVKWEGAGRGLLETSRDLNDDHARDRGRDWENKLRDRVEQERERFDRHDHRGRGRDRLERSLRDRVENRVRDRLERHGGSGRH